MKVKKILLFFLLLVTAFAFVGCKDDNTVDPGTTPDDTPETRTVETGVNDDYTLVLQEQTMDGVFNPFFYSNANDGDVLGLVNVGLLTLDPAAAVVAGDQYPTVAKSYSIFYTNNLTTYAPKTSYAEGDYVVYEIVLKNGDKFSDGTEITADDVLFNYYVYLDPSYKGSSTLYTLPIYGLQDYRTQVPNSAQYAQIASAILADDGRGQSYAQTSAYTEAQFNTYWDSFDKAGAAFCQEIVNYVLSKYLTDAFVNDYFAEGKTAADVNTDQLKVAFGMSMWGYGEISADFTKFTGASGTEYNVADLNAAKYFEEMMAANADENGKVDYQGVSDYESAGSDFVALASEYFTATYAQLGSVEKIAGLVKGTKTVDGVSYETVKVILTQQNPKAILSLGVTVAPKHYYTAGYTYKTDGLVNAGCEFDSPEFMAHLESFNASPMGAGPYKFINVEADGQVNFERNTYFETMGNDNVFNANIKKVAMKIVDGGAEYDTLKAGDVHYATVSATSDVMEEIAAQDKLAPILVDNLGYGYICINPEVYSNLNERIALTTVFDLSKVYEYYPNGLAEVIYRSSSQVSWAYPEGSTAMYPYDETLASAIAYFKAAGYTFDEATGKFTDTPTYEFYIPSDANNHPAGRIYVKAQTLLESIGVKAEIKVDANLIANIKKGPVGIYALAWQASADPDMYQVYHYLSSAESVISNGIVWLHDNGDDDTLGTIDVVKLDGTTVTMNQKEALDYLAELIEEGTTYMLAEERAPIYAKALEVLAQLNIELPTYQRKNLFVFDATVIDATSLSTTVTPYWGPLAEIWKVKFAAGTEGNKTIEVPVE